MLSLWVLLSFCLIFCKFQPGVACKSVTYKKSVYNTLKKIWREMEDRPKNGSGLAPEESPLWHSLLDQVLSDTNTNLEEAVCSDPTNTS